MTNVYLARLIWPSVPEDADTDAKKLHRSVLANARRCLHDKAPYTLQDTGFQLLREQDLDAVEQCLDNILARIGRTSEDLLVYFEAPEPTGVASKLYVSTRAVALSELGDEVETLADKSASGGIRANSFRSAFDRLEMVTLFFPSPDLEKIYRLLTKLEVLDIDSDQYTETDRHKFLVKLAGRVRSL